MLKKIIDLIVEKCIEYGDNQTKLVNITVTKNDNQTKLVNITVTKNDNQTKIVNKTVTKNDNQTKIVNITVTKNDNQTKIANKTLENSCKMYIILTIVAIVISTAFSIYFVYYNWFLIKNKDFCTKYNAHKETIIW